MSDERWTLRLEQVIPSETGASRQILDDVLGELQAQAWTPGEIHGVHLAVEEALINAIRHGNRSDASKSVHVQCRVSPRKVWVCIRDEGAGFDPAQVPDCTAPDRLECSSGRGLMLMKAFMSSVQFNEAGNCVEMEKVRKT